MAFDSSDPKFLTENCDYLHNVDCGERTQLEPPISTPHCSRLYGIFPDDKKCDVFWNCWNGEASRYQCSPGLAYDREARVCMWADQVPECKNEGEYLKKQKKNNKINSKINSNEINFKINSNIIESNRNRVKSNPKRRFVIEEFLFFSLKTEIAGGFTCPAAGEVSGSSGSFSRHAHPDDCRKYYICLEGIAREYGCPIGTVFKIGDSDGSGACEDPEDVPGW